MTELELPAWVLNLLAVTGGIAGYQMILRFTGSSLFRGFLGNGQTKSNPMAPAVPQGCPVDMTVLRASLRGIEQAHAESALRDERFLHALENLATEIRALRDDLHQFDSAQKIILDRMDRISR